MMMWRAMREMVVFALMVALTMGMATPGLAEADTVIVDIPAQDLSAALSALAEQAKVQVLYASDLASGRKTKGVVGAVTVQEAVRQLLEGTGLQYVFTDDQTVTIQTAESTGLSGVAPASFTQPQPQAKPLKVPEVVVKEVKEQGYAAQDSSTATRAGAPLRDTPLSVEVINRQVMDDQKAVRIQDVIRNVSGTSIPHNAGGRAERFNIRGFTTDVNIFKNGFRDDSTFSSRTQREVANLQRIEVLKGPASFLYGRTDPGGIINLITKTPTTSPYYAGEMIFGSYNLYRPTVDFSGPLTNDKTFLYRFNGAYEHAHSFRDLVVSERFFAAPTVVWQLGLRTNLLFEGEFLHDTRPIDRGLVAVGTGVANIPVSRFLGDPSVRNRYNQGKATLVLRHEFSDMWAWRSAFRAAVASEDYNSIEPSFLDTDNQTLFLSGFRIPQIVQSHYLQNEAVGKISYGCHRAPLARGRRVGPGDAQHTR